MSIDDPINISSPKPPRSRLAPGPPRIRSFPWPPSIQSSPYPPAIPSFPPKPEIMSFPLLTSSGPPSRPTKSSSFVWETGFSGLPGWPSPGRVIFRTPFDQFLTTMRPPLSRCVMISVDLSPFGTDCRRKTPSWVSHPRPSRETVFTERSPIATPSNVIFPMPSVSMIVSSVISSRSRTLNSYVSNPFPPCNKSDPRPPCK
ncbi:hypothetical protein CPBF424_27430 [Xanthomonas euroxanthea]|uniref:Uncharacterized protein n=1 Tax=Xanthomonas euroxanthea TaxID=2259622 RepID=A0AA46C9K7_9XANT|nr:hypothetical protein CPBF424_27430 [Xanthomonas euroxanthea]